MTSPDLKVVRMREHSLRDVPANLRAIADQIERGEYGAVGCCGLVLMGAKLELFGLGDVVQSDGMGPSVAVLFQAAANKLVRSVETHGE